MKSSRPMGTDHASAYTFSTKLLGAVTTKLQILDSPYTYFIYIHIYIHNFNNFCRHTRLGKYGQRTIMWHFLHAFQHTLRESLAKYSLMRKTFRTEFTEKTKHTF